MLAGDPLGVSSGLAMSGKGNEPVSLVSAFLNAGAKCVLASLWPVDDGACLLTMQRFLQAWRSEGQTIAAALKTAQQWLRNLTAQELLDWSRTCSELKQSRFGELQLAIEAKAQNDLDTHGSHYRPYSAPYYWAPFVAVGQAWNKEEYQ